MAGTVTRRCENPACRTPVMVSNRGKIGNAFNSTVVTSDDGTPLAICAFCATETSWRRGDVPPIEPSPLGRFDRADPSRSPECAELGHDLIQTAGIATNGRRATVYRACSRCAGVFQLEGAL